MLLIPVARAAQASSAALLGRELTVPLVAQSVVLTRAHAAVILAGRALGEDDAAGESHVYDPRRHRPGAR
ncbi:MAG: hypothetical protein ACRCY9_08670 [Phycicoccus sp.]